MLPSTQPAQDQYKGGHPETSYTITVVTQLLSVDLTVRRYFLLF